MDPYSNEFCQMELHPHFVIVTIKENVELNLDKATIIRDKLRSYYNSRSFVMISNREHKLTVSDEVYKQGQLVNMKGLAIVSNNNDVRNQAIEEQQLYRKSFTFFNSLEDATSWANSYF